MADLQRWRQTTPYLLFCCCTYFIGAILFGIDTGSFGSLQALPSFLNQFGVKNAKGVYALPTLHKSLMNSLPWVGKIVGCFAAESIIDFTGYKVSMYIVSVVQIIGIIVEMTSHHWVQFTIGRIIAYAAVGLVENAVPCYNAEIAPAALRGVLSGGLMTITALGNLWGAGMSRAYVNETAKRGWMIPVSMQFIPAVLLLVLVPLTPESPRWLMLKGRKAEAKQALDKIRPKRDVDSGSTAVEADAIDSLIEDSKRRENGTWLDIFRGNYLLRTWLASTVFIIQQMNGNQFVQSYAATFYVQEGLGAMSFTYTIVGQAIGAFGAGVGILLTDILGRRPLFIGGSVFAAFFLYLASGLGQNPHPNTNETNTIIACFIIVQAFCRISGTNNAYLLGAEIGGVRLRKKIMSFATACDVVAAFLVTFVTPYLLPSMGVNIGWIFGSVAAFSIVWGLLFFPELKARSLEEVDELFEAKLWAWQFSRYQTHGEGRLLAQIENEGLTGGTAETSRQAKVVDV